jgi:FdhD protein
MAGAEETTQRIECLVVRADTGAATARDVVREEPLRVTVNGEPAATLSCTPEDRSDLALGYLITEGLLRVPEEVPVSLAEVESSDGPAEVWLSLPGPAPVVRPEGNREKFSSGAFSRASAAAASGDLPGFHRPDGRLRPDDVFRLRDAMEAGQALFRQTGGSHAAALGVVPVEGAGVSMIVREDIGRHNALDKAVGAAARLGLPLERTLLMLSGRLSVEMLAKAARAGIADVAGVSAPSAAGVEFARRQGMFLAGFVRDDTMTVYSGADALVLRQGA